MGSLPLHRTLFIVNLSLAVLFSAAPAVRAQDVTAPAHIAVVDGNVTLERERGIEAATAGLPLIPGDRLRTTGGRVEVLFPDGSSLDADEYTTLDVQSDTLLRLVGGRALLTVAGAGNPDGAVRYQLDTPVGSARNDGPGEFRVAVMNGPAGLEGELAVLRGAAYLSTEDGSTLVRAGERSLARENSAPSSPQLFNSARFDAFDRWTSARREDRLGTASAQYLPRDLQTYGGTFDRNGSWRYEPSYGYVWYPTVSVGWRPYYNGYWTSVRSYGWTWIGLDPWGWPTHHYGRWGVSSNRWFWIPDRRWSSAWVSWASAPGYVSWCPLGFDNRPVFALTIASGNPWGGWVLAPRSHFGTPGRLVRQYAVASPSIGPRVPLVVQAGAPVAPPARAIPRSASNGGFAAAPRTNAAAPAGIAIPDATRGRAVGRQRAPEPALANRPAESPGFKLPLPDSQRRAVNAPSAVGPRSADERAALPGARPYQGGARAAERQPSLDPRSRVQPSPVPQAPTRSQEAQPRRNDSTQPARPEYGTRQGSRRSPGSPGSQGSVGSPGSQGSQGSVGSPGSVGSQGSVRAPGARASERAPDSSRPQASAGPRSAPAQAAPSAQPAPSAHGAPPQGAPPGARAAHRR